MSLVINKTFPHSDYWGLVQQKGPWRSTAADVRAARMRGKLNIGGGVGAGGTRHAGNASHLTVMTPYQLSARGNAPMPSQYVQQRVVALRPADVNAKQSRPGRRSGIRIRGDVVRSEVDEIQEPTKPETVRMPRIDEHPESESGQDSDEDTYYDSESDGEEYEDPDREVEPETKKRKRAQKSIYDLSKFPVASLAEHALAGAFDFATGNFIGAGAHIGGALGDLVKPTGLVPEDLDTNAIASIVSLGGLIESGAKTVGKSVLKGVLQPARATRAAEQAYEMAPQVLQMEPVF